MSVTNGGDTPRTYATAQLGLPFAAARQPDFAHFVGSGDATAWLRAAARGGSGKGLLVGPRGVGKTSLLGATCRAASEAGVAAAYVPLSAHAELDPDVLLGLADYALLCVDDVHAIAGKRAWERALFRCYNDCDDAGNRLVLSARATPRELGIDLADLVSRLSAALMLRLAPLGDADLPAALAARAWLCGFELDAAVSAYLLARVPRDMHTLAGIVDQLADVSLAEQRRVTVVSVKRWLADGVVSVAPA